MQAYDFNTFQAMDEVEDFFDECTFTIEEKKQTSSKRNKKKKKAEKGTPIAVAFN